MGDIQQLLSSATDPNEVLHWSVWYCLLLSLTCLETPVVTGMFADAGRLRQNETFLRASRVTKSIAVLAADAVSGHASVGHRCLKERRS